MYFVAGRLNQRKGKRSGSERAHTPAGKGGGSGSTKMSSVSIPRAGSSGSAATASTHALSHPLPPTTVSSVAVIVTACHMLRHLPHINVP